MKQLDFSSVDFVRTAERERRHDAFWGPLNETRRTAARVACDFFVFAEEVCWHLAQQRRLDATDDEKAVEAFIKAQMYSKAAMEKFRLFGRLTGSRDDAEAAGHLDRLIAHARNTRWQIHPLWWTNNPAKNTACFIGQLRPTGDSLRLSRRRLLPSLDSGHGKTF